MQGVGPASGASKYGIYPMEDSKYFYVYENQRWNPLTGFTTHGLPTDRYSWSDRTGRLNLTKDNIRLPSVHWQWVSSTDGRPCSPSTTAFIA